jgi:hypothetical protein
MRFTNFHKASKKGINGSLQTKRYLLTSFNPQVKI